MDALPKAVELRLIADVPVGVLLSGGLDSSLIVGLLAEQGQRGLNTFSVGFESVDEEKGDEFQYSDIIARHFDTDHHQIRVDSARLLPALQHCIQAMSEPMVSHDVIGFYLLSQEVSKHVKVVQSGQGADEVFAGYHWYPPLRESSDPLADYAEVFFDRDHSEFAEAVHPRFVSDDFSRAFVAQHFSARPVALFRQFTVFVQVVLRGARLAERPVGERQPDQHQCHLQVQRGQDSAVRHRERDQQNANTQHKPGFVRIPERTDRGDHHVLL